MTVTEKLDVIVIGAGYAGLAAAIELARKGINVKVFEGIAKLSNHGDVLQLASNASKVLSKWGNCLEVIQASAGEPSSMRCQDQLGKTLLEQPLPTEYGGFPNLYCNRGGVQKVMYDHAVSLGVTFNFGTRITKVFDSEDGAGIYVGDEKMVADAVIVADGVHSKGRAYVTGVADKPTASGFAVYRSWFPLKALEGEPLLKEFVETKETIFRVWIGLNTHGIVLTNPKMQTCVCFYTHKDSYAVEESWSYPGKVADMLAAVEGWDETYRAVVKRIPEDVLIDFKLLWRDPFTKWVSDNGRVVIVGDAAHPHLATSGQGAAQAIEDGATLGALLDRSGKQRIPSALRAFEKLRSQRTSLTQRQGWELRQVWHQTPWDLVRENPEILKMPQPDWLLGGDAEKYAYDNYDAVISHVEHGTPFVNTNLPEGYVHEDWTIDSMLAKERAQEAAMAEALALAAKA